MARLAVRLSLHSPKRRREMRSRSSPSPPLHFPVWRKVIRRALVGWRMQEVLDLEMEGEIALPLYPAMDLVEGGGTTRNLGTVKKATGQMDIYSFGVILLELITGRATVFMEPGKDSVDVVKWVRRKFNISNAALLVVDPKILLSSFKQEILGALEMALQCTSVVPEKRPSMAEVMRGLYMPILRAFDRLIAEVYICQCA